MGKYFKGYRIDTARMKHWNYQWQAAYFVTINTASNEHYFGSIDNGAMALSEIGHIAHTEWLKTPALRPDMNITLDAFVVMPNHFHAIIIIGKNRYNTPMGNWANVDYRIGAMHGGIPSIYDQRTAAMHGGSTTPICNEFDQRTDAMHGVSTDENTTHGGSTTPNERPNQNRFGPQSKNLASIIRGYKSAVTMAARRIKPDFAWHSRYHDHIIRNAKEYQTIKHYIINNPAKWADDKFHSK